MRMVQWQLLLQLTRVEFQLRRLRTVRLLIHWSSVIYQVVYSFYLAFLRQSGSFPIEQTHAINFVLELQLQRIGILLLPMQNLFPNHVSNLFLKDRQKFVPNNILDSLETDFVVLYFHGGTKSTGFSVLFVAVFLLSKKTEGSNQPQLNTFFWGLVIRI